MHVWYRERSGERLTVGKKKKRKGTPIQFTYNRPDASGVRQSMYLPVLNEHGSAIEKS